MNSPRAVKIISGRGELRWRHRTRNWRSAWDFALAVAIVIVSRPAAAQSGTTLNKPLAEELFSSAREELSRGHYGAACGKLAESQRMDPATGTLLNLAICHELEGKLASAWAEYREVSAVSAREAMPERKQIADERLALLTPKLSYVTLLPPSPAPAAFEILLDDTTLGPASYGVPLPVDSGAHVVRLRVAGRQWSMTRVQIAAEADHQTIRLLLPSPLGATRPQRPRSAAVPKTGHDTRVLLRDLGFGALGLAALSAGVGGYFGLRAAADWRARNRYCPNGQCDARAVEAWRSAQGFALLADAGFALTVLAGATGSYLLVVAGAGGASSAPRAALLQIGGTL